MATCLVLSNTVPGQPQKPSETHYQKAAEVESPRLAPLAAMTALQHLDLSTTPALLFFGLGIKVTAQVPQLFECAPCNLQYKAKLTAPDNQDRLRR